MKLYEAAPWVFEYEIGQIDEIKRATLEQKYPEVQYVNILNLLNFV